MKKYFVMIVLGLAISSVVAWAGNSQGHHNKGQHKQGGHGQHDGADRMAKMQENLGLSDKQVEQIREIRKTGGNREAMQAVLTDEQRARMREHRGGKHDRSHGDARGHEK